jgi:putative ABC transport system permease protein
MEFRPILSALMRNKVGMVLIGLQVALTLAIVVNALFIINQRLGNMARPSGLDEPNIFMIGSLGFTPNFDVRATIDGDLRMLRDLPGVVDAYASNTLPLTNGGWSSGFRAVEDPEVDGVGTAMYFADDHTLNTLGVQLIAGRNFNADEIGTNLADQRLRMPVTIISAEYAKRLFPDETDLGKIVGRSIYEGDPGQEQQAIQVIGIVERLQAPWVSWNDVLERSMLVPAINYANGNESRYVVRTEPGQRDRVLKEVEAKLAEIEPGRIVRRPRTFETIRAEGYQGDRAMAILLGSVIVGLLAITGLGIVGLASFWVSQRTKQIGTRRALGATRGGVMRYFQTENFIITLFGLILGTILAYALNIYLVNAYALPKLSWYYVPIGALCLVALGQLAVFGPARRAARVSPAVATRGA